jgi:hypothetical protein
VFALEVQGRSDSELRKKFDLNSNDISSHYGHSAQRPIWHSPRVFSPYNPKKHVFSAPFVFQ